MFKEYVKVNPLKLLFKYKVNPNLYMRVVGTLEAAGACLLCLAPRPLKIFANLVLMVLMMVAIQTLYFLKVPQQMYTPPSVLLFLLICNLYFMRKQPLEVHVKAE